MNDAILYTDDRDAIPEELQQGQPKSTNGNKRLHYVRVKTEQLTALKEHYTVLAETPYKGVGTADYLYEHIQQRGELAALYHEVCPLKQLYWTDPETGEVDYDAAMGTEFVRFGMLAESPLPVPKSVSARQGMEQLIRLGLDEQVDTAIDEIDDPIQRKIVRNWFEKAGEWERNNPQFVALSEKLGLSAEQSDDYMREAATL